jgi:hypothetical protein
VSEPSRYGLAAERVLNWRGRPGSPELGYVGQPESYRAQDWLGQADQILDDQWRFDFELVDHSKTWRIAYGHGRPGFTAIHT